MTNEIKNAGIKALEQWWNELQGGGNADEKLAVEVAEKIQQLKAHGGDSGGGSFGVGNMPPLPLPNDPSQPKLRSAPPPRGQYKEVLDVTGNPVFAPREIIRTKIKGPPQQLPTNPAQMQKDAEAAQKAATELAKLSATYEDRKQDGEEK